jgi:hypothetical protein
LSSAKKKKGKERMWKIKIKKWTEINTLKVVKVKSLNLGLYLLWKDLGVKLERIVEDYKAILLSKF